MKPSVEKTALVFYAGMLYRTYTRKDMYAQISPVITPEIYQGGYVYLPEDRQWFRCDLTPVLDEDVPKDLKALLLLLS